MVLTQDSVQATFLTTVQSLDVDHFVLSVHVKYDVPGFSWSHRSLVMPEIVSMKEDSSSFVYSSVCYVAG